MRRPGMSETGDLVAFAPVVDGLPQDELGIGQTPGPAKVASCDDPDSITRSSTRPG
ncbi:MAG: hypothetical protein JWL73_1851 [Actinomycetia bacterium]|nr:hypothetical protein [Actinomycetes bacterium]